MNKNVIWILVGIGLIILLISFRKPIKKAVSNMTRGYKNNNPGNIRLTYKNGKKTFWTGEIEGTDKDFKTFSSMAYGYRAMLLLLKGYINSGYDTITKIISRYAPTNENDTQSYIKSVSQRSGISPDAKITFSDMPNVLKLVAAMSYHENGINPDINQISEGSKLL